MKSPGSQLYQHGQPSATALDTLPSSNMFRYEPTAGDASRIKSVTLNLQGRRLEALSAAQQRINLFLGKCWRRGRGCHERAPEKKRRKYSSSKMTCHFKCQPYCLGFPDNCSIRIRGKHRALIRKCLYACVCVCLCMYVATGVNSQQAAGRDRVIKALWASLKTHLHLALLHRCHIYFFFQFSVCALREVLVQ